MSLTNKKKPNLLLLIKNQKYGISILRLILFLNQGYIYNHDNIYIIKKFCKFETSNGYLYLDDSIPLNIKNIQNTTANITCQNLAIKPIVT